MPSDEELKERLRKQADELIEAIVANKKPAGQNSLADIQQLTIGAGQRLEERVLAELTTKEGAAEVHTCSLFARRL